MIKVGGSPSNDVLQLTICLVTPLARDGQSDKVLSLSDTSTLDRQRKKLSAFQVEKTVRFTQAEFVKLNSPLSTRFRWPRRLLVLVAGAAMLFWSYTLLLGVAVLVSILMAIFAPQMFPAGAARTYRDTPYLKGELTFGADSEELWVKGKQLYARCSWANLRVWDERAGWLILRPAGMPSLYFSTQELIAAGAYEPILDQAKRHGRKFNAKDA